MRELTIAELAERSIFKTYRKEIWNPFIASLKDYNLLQPNDCVAVCISGGKDSFLLALLFKLLSSRSDFPIKVKYIVINPGYEKKYISLIKKNAKTLDIPLKIIDKNIFSVAEKESTVNGKIKNPCYMCARLRRGVLYKSAKELGCNKIALGHHMDDVCETILISMFYGAQLQCMTPKAKSENFENISLIRPLYKVREKDIIRFKNYNNLSFLDCACSFTQSIKKDGKRKEIKDIIKNLEKINPEICSRIFAAAHNVNADTFPEIKLNGKRINPFNLK